MGAPSAPTFGQKLSVGAAGGALLGFQVGQQSGPVAGAIASGLAVIAPFTGPAAPFLMAAASLVGPIAAKFGCGKPCIQASEFADLAGSKQKELVDMYWAQPVRYKSMQLQTLAYLDQLADWLRAACSDPSLKDAGVRCISERLVRGGTAPWCPTADHTGCDFYTAVRDPIANDTGVVADPSPVDQAAGSLLSLFGGGSSSSAAADPGWLLPALLLVGGFMIAREL